jgi:hypothetical protein
LDGHHSQAVEFGQAVNRLLVQAAAEVPEIEGRAVIREGKNGDGVRGAKILGEKFWAEGATGN